jgi:hypothetical protein
MGETKRGSNPSAWKAVASVFGVGYWPWVSALSVANGVLLVVGSVGLVLLISLNMPALFVYTFFAAVVLILLDVLTGNARDIRISE